ncbi:MAG: hypothetical protein HW419_4714 [Deltaproteobacteria bacterium]|nr:hypothetical protein [Deltaproteobacteria bacterium]
MSTWLDQLRRSFLGLFLVFLMSAGAGAGESSPALTARDSGVPLYAQQDLQSEPLSRLQKGEALTPMFESVGQEVWYMVRTKQGLVGWVRGVDVVVSSQVKDTFREKEAVSSSWAARTEDGQTFVGTFTVAANATARAARGFWTLKDANGATVLSGGWSAEMHTTGANGTWRASAEGRQGHFSGSWSAELAQVKKAGFTEMFEAAIKDAVRGLWTGTGQSGSWTIRTFK